jgi:hypothetical protein
MHWSLPGWRIYALYRQKRGLIMVTQNVAEQGPEVAQCWRIEGKVMTYRSSVHLGTFAFYLLASWFVLLCLLRCAARRKYYFHLVPSVVAYAVLVAFLLQYFSFQDFFWWYLVLSSSFFFANFRRHLGSRNGIDAFARLQETVTESVPEGEIRQQVAKELSPGRQIRQHAVLSVIVFILSFVLTFYLANGGL